MASKKKKSKKKTKKAKKKKATKKKLSEMLPQEEVDIIVEKLRKRIQEWLKENGGDRDSEGKIRLRD